MHAYVDESVLRSIGSPQIYIVGAVVIPPSSQISASITMQALRQGGRKLHWRDESDRRRELITRSMSELDLNYAVAIHRCDGDTRSERARHVCLKVLLPHLHTQGVRVCSFESRGAADDRRDVNVVQGLRQGRVLSSAFRVGHVPGPTEPLLWIADALCGMAASAERGNALNLQHLRDNCSVVSLNAE